MKMYTTKEVSEETGIPERRLYYLVSLGLVSPSRHAGRMVWTQKDLARARKYADRIVRAARKAAGEES